MGNVLGPLEVEGSSSLLPRRLLMWGISLVTLLLVLLLVDIFYVQFSLVTRTGDAQLQRWIGPDAVKVAGILLGLLFGTCYLVVASSGTRERETARAWQLGAVAGAGAGGVVLLLYLFTGLITISLGELEIPVFTIYGFALLGTLLVGIFARVRGGQVSAGTISGFWFGVLLALLASVSALTRDVIFAQHLASTVWPGDHFSDLTCQGAKGVVLVNCEVGDTVGFAANTLLVLPLLGLLLGTGGGALGRLFTRQKMVRTATWKAPLVAPLICMGFLLIIFIAEAIWNLW